MRTAMQSALMKPAELFAGGQSATKHGNRQRAQGRKDPKSLIKLNRRLTGNGFSAPHKNRIERPHREDAKSKNTRDAMQSNTRVGGFDAATIQFVHVDPATGKNTTWSFAISKASRPTPLDSE